MKKILLFASALAGLFLAGSCQRENLEPVATGITYEISLPEVVQTKADVHEYDEYDLYYEVYKTVSDTDLAKSETKPLFENKVTMTGNSHTLSLDLLNDQDYTILFWANKKDNYYFVLDDLRNVGIKEASSNNDDRDAFCGKDQISKHDGAMSKTVELKRPFAQVNIATVVKSVGYDIKPISSLVKFTKIPTAYNVLEEEQVGANAEVTYGVNWVPEGNLDVAGVSETYKKVAMNYILVPEGTVDVYYEINTVNGTVKNTIPNVPVKKNYRTNIIGNLLTSNATYTIEVKPGFEGDNAGHVNVINEGIVKNINGDYEVSSANGLAYAMNNLFVEEGNFYLTAAEYDLTGFNVTAPTIPSGVTLNIYGETPVVTRAATTFAGITIIGLPEVNGKPALIEAVENGGTVAVSGVTLQDEGSVIVSNNQGTLVVSESEAASYVADGNDPVEADNVKNIDTLVAALASDVKVIELAADIEATEALEIKRSITINGNGKKLTSSASRVVNFTAPEIVVEFNDWAFVSTAARNGQNGPRGLNIWGPEVHDAELTFNRCSVDFTHETANDWTYAVNCGVNQNNTITINGGTYEGANVVNVWGKNHTITIDGAVLTSLYQPSSAYYGFCVSLQEAENSKATIKNSTLNSVHAKAFGGTTKNEFVLENNTDNTQVYPFFIGNAPYLTLNEAFAAAENNATIYAPFNAEIASSTVPEGKKVTLVLQNQATKYNTQLTGVDNLTGSFGLINVNPGADLTITGPGSIKLSATNNRGWNAYSSVVSNQRGTLTVNGGAVIEHLGGTDMAYGIDNLTNGKGTKATTIVDGATVKSTYRAIRQFLNGTEATNDLTVKAGSVVEGANKSIWMQDPNTYANSGKLVVEEGAQLKGDVYLFVTPESTEWPVSASIPASTLMDGSEVITGNVPEGYSVENVGGTWKVIKWSEVSTADELVAALAAGQNVIFMDDITVAATDGGYDKAGILQNKGQAINGNGHTLTVTGAGATWSCAIYTNGGLIKNLTVAGAMRGIFTAGQSSDLHIDNVVFKNVIYTFNSDGTMPAKPFGVYISNSTVNGWTSHSDMHSEVVYTNCSFGEGSGYKFCRPYGKTSFVKCTFCAGYTIDQSKTMDITFDNCTYEE